VLLRKKNRVDCGVKALMGERQATTMVMERWDGSDRYKLTVDDRGQNHKFIHEVEKYLQKKVKGSMRYLILMARFRKDRGISLKYHLFDCLGFYQRLCVYFFVMVSLTSQYLFYFRDGSHLIMLPLIFESDI
jgi:hypothetical protein